MPQNKSYDKMKFPNVSAIMVVSRCVSYLGYLHPALLQKRNLDGC